MLYVANIKLEVDGQNIEDFNAVTEKEVELYKQVNLMNKTGHSKATPRYGVSVDYVIPESDTEFDFEGVRDGRLTIEYENGKRITFIGLYPLKIGEATYKVDSTEVTRTIEFGATGRVVE